MSDPRAVRQRNCSLVASGYGTRSVYCRAFGHGVEIVSDESEAKDRRAFYVSRTTTGSFLLLLEFPTQAEYDDVGAWLRGYIERLSSGQISPMRVIVPDRRFDRVAIPRTGVTFGAQSGRIVHTMALTFVTTADPLSHFSALIARYELPHGDQYNVSRFHPAGVQVGGAVESNLYDRPADREDYLEDIARQTGIPLNDVRKQF